MPMYATNVEHAFDFLTKDMGEDRSVYINGKCMM